MPSFAPRLRSLLAASTLAALVAGGCAPDGLEEADTPAGASDLSDPDSVQQALSGGPYDVGVLAPAANCPGRFDIYMDDEDSGNNSSRSGWIGASGDGSNTRFGLCRVDGSRFTKVGWCNAMNSKYAVLKLGSACPNGSKEITRYFDNEDSSNNNWFTGDISPSIQSAAGTRLKLCVFLPLNALVKCTATSPTLRFPDLGFSYGVFGVPDIQDAIQGGSMYSDDEDSGNNNSWDLSGLSAWEQDRVREFMSGSSNTLMKTVRVR
jgi:hypothetical protein